MLTEPWKQYNISISARLPLTPTGQQKKTYCYTNGRTAAPNPHAARRQDAQAVPRFPPYARKPWGRSGRWAKRWRFSAMELVMARRIISTRPCHSAMANPREPRQKEGPNYGSVFMFFFFAGEKTYGGNLWVRFLLFYVFPAS